MNLKPRLYLGVVLLSFFLGAPQLWAQGPADRISQPIRLNLVQPTPLSPNGQQPPYAWSGAYLRNAFGQVGQNLPDYQIDSALCGTGINNSTNYEDNLKAFFSYQNGPEGPLVSEVLFTEKQANSSFENYSRKRFQYQDGLRTKYQYQRWNANSQSWQDDYEEETTYNAQGQWTSFISQEKNGGQWEPIDRKQAVYGPGGNLIRLTEAEHNGNTWEFTSRIEANYTAIGYYKKLIQQAWNGSAWDTLTRETAIFDSSQMIWTGYVLETYDNNTRSFDSTARETYNYDRRGFWTGMVHERYQNASQQWRNHTRETYAYTKAGVWIGWSQESWQGNAWRNKVRQRYDPSGQFRTDLMQVWDTVNNSWQNNSRALIMFDTNGNLAREASAQEWDANGQQWLNTDQTQRCIYSWSPLNATSIRQELPNLRCAIPNPYPQNASIHCESMEPGHEYDLMVIDMQGRQVLRKSLKGGQTFRLQQELPVGVYQMSIFEQGQLRHSQKIMMIR